MIDQVLFSSDKFRSRRKLVKNFTQNQYNEGSCMILLPTNPSLDLKPFYSNLFFPSGRYHNIRGFNLSNKKSLGEIDYLLFR